MCTNKKHRSFIKLTISVFVFLIVLTGCRYNATQNNINYNEAEVPDVFLENNVPEELLYRLIMDDIKIIDNNSSSKKPYSFKSDLEIQGKSIDGIFSTSKPYSIDANDDNKPEIKVGYTLFSYDDELDVLMLIDDRPNINYLGRGRVTLFGGGASHQYFRYSMIDYNWDSIWSISFDVYYLGEQGVEYYIDDVLVSKEQWEVLKSKYDEWEMEGAIYYSYEAIKQGQSRRIRY